METKRSEVIGLNKVKVGMSCVYEVELYVGSAFLSDAMM